MGNNHSNSVHILHSGSDVDNQVISYLEMCNALNGPQAYNLEYRKYQQKQSKEVLLINDAQRYKKEKLPMIVVLSKEFFDLIWVSTEKAKILSVITSYSSRSCVHIWVDIDEDYLRRRAKALLRKDGQFRTIIEWELKSLRPIEVIGKLKDLMTAKGPTTYNLLNNHAIDDEGDEMRRYFEQMNLGYSKNNTSVETKPNKKPPGNNYSNALQYVTMSTSDLETMRTSERQTADRSVTRLIANKNNQLRQNARMPIEQGGGGGGISVERDVGYRQDFSHAPVQRKVSGSGSSGGVPKNNTVTFQDTPSSSTNKKKKGNKRRGDSSTINFLTDLTEKDKKQVCIYLDQGPGANWKQLAQALGLNSYVKNIESFSSAKGPTETFLEVLSVNKPELEVEEFAQKCKQIIRTDVSAYLMRNALN